MYMRRSRKPTNSAVSPPLFLPSFLPFFLPRARPHSRTAAPRGAPRRVRGRGRWVNRRAGRATRLSSRSPRLAARRPRARLKSLSRRRGVLARCAAQLKQRGAAAAPARHAARLLWSRALRWRAMLEDGGPLLVASIATLGTARAVVAPRGGGGSGGGGGGSRAWRALVVGYRVDARRLRRRPSLASRPCRTSHASTKVS